MGTNCAPFVLLCERLLALVCDVYCGFVTFPCGILGQVWYLIVLIPDFYRLPLMLSLSDNIQADFGEAFNSASRYLDVLLNIDDPYFEQMVRQIYPTELELNKAFL